jgi:hypothetical protein
VIEYFFISELLILRRGHKGNGAENIFGQALDKMDFLGKKSPQALFAALIC